jgi:hypothetical protein
VKIKTYCMIVLTLMLAACAGETPDDPAADPRELTLTATEHCQGDPAESDFFAFILPRPARDYVTVERGEQTDVIIGEFSGYLDFAPDRRSAAGVLQNLRSGCWYNAELR